MPGRPRRTCPLCTERYAGLVEASCPLCAGDGFLTLGSAREEPAVVARAVDLYLGGVHLPAHRGERRVVLQQCLLALVSAGLIEAPAGPGTPPQRQEFPTDRQKAGTRAGQLVREIRGVTPRRTAKIPVRVAPEPITTQPVDEVAAMRARKKALQGQEG